MYLGTIINPRDTIEYDIAEAEKLLLYNCCPAYNSYEIGDYKKPLEIKEDIILFNFGEIGSIPNEVSSL